MGPDTMKLSLSLCILGLVAAAPAPQEDEMIEAVPYVHEEIAAEPYVHDEPLETHDIAAEAYAHNEIEAEPYVHEDILLSLMSTLRSRLRPMSMRSPSPLLLCTSTLLWPPWPMLDIPTQ